MNCADAWDLLPQLTAGELGDYPDLEMHLRDCSPCSRQAELFRKVWDLAGLASDESLPDKVVQDVYDSIERVRRRPRRMLNSLLRLGTVAAAAVLLAAGAWWLAGPESPAPRHYMVGPWNSEMDLFPEVVPNSDGFPLDLVFKETPWAEVLSALRKVSDVEIVVDSEVSDRLSRRTPVTASFREETLGEILDRVIAPHGLEYAVLEEGVILITTSERLRHILTQRVYRIEYSDEESKALVEELRSTLPPGSFDAAERRYIEFMHGVLVVRTDLLSHRQLRVHLAGRRCRTVGE